ncbi:MAG: TIGR01620 family protein [Alphaproteobacteria bacterium]|nr:TIGR01620 family protein [Alphaproteobacteria bacterium]
MTTKRRKPTSVPMIDDTERKPEPTPKRSAAKAAPRRPVSVSEPDRIVEDSHDPFTPVTGDAAALASLSGADAETIDALTPEVAKPRRRRISFTKIAFAAFGLLFSLVFAVWLDGVIQSFFARAPWLGWTASALVAIGALSLLVVAVREVVALIRLDSVQSLKILAEAAANEKNPAKARQVLSRLRTLFSGRPETARDRARLAEFDDDIIDGPHLVDLAETTLLGPLDSEARILILAASKRVSVVTALSPRAFVDIGYVLFEAMRLIRGLALLYGGRPGTLGMVRLTRDVVGHLAVTGSIAIGDGVIQQLLGHGLATKLSAKLGEGIINGMMTARIGIAAMDLCRPLPFRAAKRPGIGEFVGDLTRQATGTKKNKA